MQHIKRVAIKLAVVVMMPIHILAILLAAAGAVPLVIMNKLLDKVAKL